MTSQDGLVINSLSKTCLQFFRTVFLFLDGSMYQSLSVSLSVSFVLSFVSQSLCASALFCLSLSYSLSSFSLSVYLIFCSVSLCTYVSLLSCLTLYLSHTNTHSIYNIYLSLSLFPYFLLLQLFASVYLLLCLDVQHIELTLFCLSNIMFFFPYI